MAVQYNKMIISTKTQYLDKLHQPYCIIQKFGKAIGKFKQPKMTQNNPK